MKHPLLFAILACSIAALGEGLFMGRGGSGFLKTLKQPSWAPPLWVWTLIGIAYYAICFIAICRLTRRAPVDWMSTGLLLLVMAANTFWNYLYFRLRDMRVAFWYSVAYSALAVALLVLMARSDAGAALAFAVYVAYLPYALFLSHRTWRLNS